MKLALKDIYRCPYTGGAVALATIETGPDVKSGTLICGARRYDIVDGIPHLISDADENPSETEKREYAYYESNNKLYDAIMDWLFESFYEDESQVREGMIDLLEVRPGSRILETGCGTCRDSIRIARRLGSTGELFLQDISPKMLQLGRARIETFAEEHPLPQTEVFVSNALRLPFPDNYFDGAFHFGGLNLFSDKAAALREMARVVRVGGKVVAGDESMAPWLRETIYGKVIMNSNSLYHHQPPIDFIPESARDVCLRWIIGNAYYVIDFGVAEGPPKVDLDKPILGARGGTHRSRYYGTLEGVTIEVKKLAQQAAADSGLSMHEWLDRAVREQARLENKNKS